MCVCKCKDMYWYVSKCTCTCVHIFVNPLEQTPHIIWALTLALAVPLALTLAIALALDGLAVSLGPWVLGWALDSSSRSPLHRAAEAAHQQRRGNALSWNANNRLDMRVCN